VVTLKELELKLISELMKNSRKSDRELAKAIGVSQPTVSRLRVRLEKEGIIKEYTMIPDFSKLGFNLMSIIMLKLNSISDERIQQLHKEAHELDNQERRPFLMIMNGLGLGKNVAILAFHEDYGDYDTYIKEIKNAEYSTMKAYVDVEETEGFLIDLKNKDHYQPLAFAKIAANLQEKGKKSAPAID
jgi:DNA-binding Lrp family transcriptional regulator